MVHGYRDEAAAWLERAVAALDARAEGVDDPDWARELVVKAYLLLDDVPAAIAQAAAIATPGNRVRALLAAAERCQEKGIEKSPAIDAALAQLAKPKAAKPRRR